MKRFLRAFLALLLCLNLLSTSFPVDVWAISVSPSVQVSSLQHRLAQEAFASRAGWFFHGLSSRFARIPSAWAARDPQVLAVMADTWYGRLHRATYGDDQDLALAVVNIPKLEWERWGNSINRRLKSPSELRHFIEQTIAIYSEMPYGPLLPVIRDITETEYRRAIGVKAHKEKGRAIGLSSKEKKRLAKSIESAIRSEAKAQAFDEMVAGHTPAVLHREQGWITLTLDEVRKVLRPLHQEALAAMIHAAIELFSSGRSYRATALDVIAGAWKESHRQWNMTQPILAVAGKKMEPTPEDIQHLSSWLEQKGIPSTLRQEKQIRALLTQQAAGAVMSKPGPLKQMYQQRWRVNLAQADAEALAKAMRDYSGNVPVLEPPVAQSVPAAPLGDDPLLILAGMGERSPLADPAKWYIHFLRAPLKDWVSRAQRGSLTKAQWLSEAEAILGPLAAAEGVDVAVLLHFGDSNAGVPLWQVVHGMKRVSAEVLRRYQLLVDVSRDGKTIYAARILGIERTVDVGRDHRIPLYRTQAIEGYKARDMGNTNYLIYPDENDAMYERVFGEFVPYWESYHDPQFNVHSVLGDRGAVLRWIVLKMMVHSDRPESVPASVVEVPHWKAWMQESDLAYDIAKARQGKDVETLWERAPLLGKPGEEVAYARALVRPSTALAKTLEKARGDDQRDIAWAILEMEGVLDAVRRSPYPAYTFTEFASGVRAIGNSPEHQRALIYLLSALSSELFHEETIQRDPWDVYMRMALANLEAYNDDLRASAQRVYMSLFQMPEERRAASSGDAQPMTPAQIAEDTLPWREAVHQAIAAAAEALPLLTAETYLSPHRFDVFRTLSQAMQDWYVAVFEKAIALSNPQDRDAALELLSGDSMLMSWVTQASRHQAELLLEHFPALRGIPIHEVTPPFMFYWGWLVTSRLVLPKEILNRAEAQVAALGRAESLREHLETLAEKDGRRYWADLPESQRQEPESRRAYLRFRLFRLYNAVNYADTLDDFVRLRLRLQVLRKRFAEVSEPDVFVSNQTRIQIGLTDFLRKHLPQLKDLRSLRQVGTVVFHLFPENRTELLPLLIKKMGALATKEKDRDDLRQTLEWVEEVGGSDEVQAILRSRVDALAPVVIARSEATTQSPSLVHPEEIAAAHAGPRDDDKKKNKKKKTRVSRDQDFDNDNDDLLGPVPQAPSSVSLPKIVADAGAPPVDLELHVNEAMGEEEGPAGVQKGRLKRVAGDLAKAIFSKDARFPELQVRGVVRDTLNETIATLLEQGISLQDIRLVSDARSAVRIEDGRVLVIATDAMTLETLLALPVHALEAEGADRPAAMHTAGWAAALHRDTIENPAYLQMRGSYDRIEIPDDALKRWAMWKGVLADVLPPGTDDLVAFINRLANDDKMEELKHFLSRVVTPIEEMEFFFGEVVRRGIHDAKRGGVAREAFFDLIKSRSVFTLAENRFVEAHPWVYFQGRWILRSVDQRLEASLREAFQDIAEAAVMGVYDYFASPGGEPQNMAATSEGYTFGIRKHYHWNVEADQPGSVRPAAMADPSGSLPRSVADLRPGDFIAWKISKPRVTRNFVQGSADDSAVELDPVGEIQDVSRNDQEHNTRVTILRRYTYISTGVKVTRPVTLIVSHAESPERFLRADGQPFEPVETLENLQDAVEASLAPGWNPIVHAADFVVPGASVRLVVNGETVVEGNVRAFENGRLFLQGIDNKGYMPSTQFPWEVWISGSKGPGRLITWGEPLVETRLFLSPDQGAQVVKPRVSVFSERSRISHPWVLLASRPEARVVGAWLRAPDQTAPDGFVYGIVTGIDKDITSIHRTDRSAPVRYALSQASVRWEVYRGDGAYPLHRYQFPALEDTLLRQLAALQSGLVWDVTDRLVISSYEALARALGGDALWFLSDATAPNRFFLADYQGIEGAYRLMDDLLAAVALGRMVWSHPRSQTLSPRAVLAAIQSYTTKQGRVSSLLAPLFSVEKYRELDQALAAIARGEHRKDYMGYAGCVKFAGEQGVHPANLYHHFSEKYGMLLHWHPTERLLSPIREDALYVADYHALVQLLESGHPILVQSVQVQDPWGQQEVTLHPFSWDKCRDPWDVYELTVYLNLLALHGYLGFDGNYFKSSVPFSAKLLFQAMTHKHGFSMPQGAADLYWAGKRELDRHPEPYQGTEGRVNLVAYLQGQGHKVSDRKVHELFGAQYQFNLGWFDSPRRAPEGQRQGTVERTVFSLNAPQRRLAQAFLDTAEIQALSNAAAAIKVNEQFPPAANMRAVTYKDVWAYRRNQTKPTPQEAASAMHTTGWVAALHKHATESPNWLQMQARFSQIDIPEVAIENWTLWKGVLADVLPSGADDLAAYIKKLAVDGDMEDLKRFLRYIVAPIEEMNLFFKEVVQLAIREARNGGLAREFFFAHIKRQGVFQRMENRFIQAHPWVYFQGRWFLRTVNQPLEASLRGAFQDIAEAAVMGVYDYFASPGGEPQNMAATSEGYTFGIRKHYHWNVEADEEGADKAAAMAGDPLSDLFKARIDDALRRGIASASSAQLMQFLKTHKDSIEISTEIIGLGGEKRDFWVTLTAKPDAPAGVAEYLRGPENSGSYLNQVAGLILRGENPLGTSLRSHGLSLVLDSAGVRAERKQRIEEAFARAADAIRNVRGAEPLLLYSIPEQQILKRMAGNFPGIGFDIVGPRETVVKMPQAGAEYPVRVVSFEVHFYRKTDAYVPPVRPQPRANAQPVERAPQPQPQPQRPVHVPAAPVTKPAEEKPQPQLQPVRGQDAPAGKQTPPKRWEDVAGFFPEGLVTNRGKAIDFFTLFSGLLSSVQEPDALMQILVIGETRVRETTKGAGRKENQFLGFSNLLATSIRSEMQRSSEPVDLEWLLKKAQNILFQKYGIRSASLPVDSASAMKSNSWYGQIHQATFRSAGALERTLSDMPPAAKERWGEAIQERSKDVQALRTFIETVVAVEEEIGIYDGLMRVIVTQSLLAYELVFRKAVNSRQKSQKNEGALVRLDKKQARELSRAIENRLKRTTKNGALESLARQHTPRIYDEAQGWISLTLEEVTQRLSPLHNQVMHALFHAAAVARIEQQTEEAVFDALRNAWKAVHFDWNQQNSTKAMAASA